MEKWLDVVGYEGLYKVSNLGRVKSERRVMTQINGSKRLWEECILSQMDSRGYKYLTLYNGIKPKQVTVHRLLAIAFIPNPDDKPEVNHIDGVPSNNHISNLEWCTSSENTLHSYRLGLQKPMYKEALKMAINARKRKVDKFDLQGNYIETYESITEGARMNNANNQNIGKVLKGERNKTGGYHWKYTVELEELKQ